MIGSQLLLLLLESDDYSEVTALVRHPLGVSHSKLHEGVVDFENTQQLNEGIPADSTLFCCIGTTQKKVKGDKKAYRKVDFEIPITIATLAAAKNATSFLLVSAVGADARSGNFYLQLKGETERALESMHFPSLHVFRPSLLLGNRKESRRGESIMQWLMRPLSSILKGNFSRYRAIPAVDVARAMIRASLENRPGIFRYYWKEMQELNISIKHPRQ